MSSRSVAEVRRYDLFKLIVTLLLLLLLPAFTGIGRAPAIPPEVVTPTAVVVVSGSTDVPTIAPATVPATAPTTIPAISAPTLTSPKPGDWVTSESTLSGTGAPGSQVQIVVDGNIIDTTTVAADGSWSLPIKLEAGDHTITVQTLDTSGKVVAESEPLKVTAEAVATAPATPTPVAPAPTQHPSSAIRCTGTRGVDQGPTWLVAECDTMSFIARQTSISLSALIVANPQVKNPNVIFPGQLINLPR